MGPFIKIASLAVVIVAGSVVALWQAFAGNTFVAWLALAAMGGMAVALIAATVRDTLRDPFAGMEQPNHGAAPATSPAVVVED